MKLKSNLSVATVFISVLSLTGCSIGSAINAAAPVEYKKVHLNQARSETISILGIPKLTDTKENQKTDTFEFLDGFHQASKARVLLYLAGDVFTLGLAEAIFWPLEKLALDGKQCRGLVGYNTDDHVVRYDILDSHGEHLWSSTGKASNIARIERTQIDAPVITTENNISENKTAAPMAVTTKIVEKPKTTSAIVINSKLIEKIQTALTSDHYYHGDISGELNEDTRNAISVYKELNNLSGKSIDKAFLNALGVE